MPKIKRDANHKEISDAFENLGATVQDTAMIGNGFPDIVIGYLGYNIPVEIKTENGKLSKKQEDWFANWRGVAAVVKYTWQVTRLICYLDEAYYTNIQNITTKLLETYLKPSGG
jgi:hypothetical protein